MNFVPSAAKKSPRLVAVCLIIVLVSTLGLASGWEGISTFATEYPTNQNSELTAPSQTNALIEEFVKGQVFVAPGTCETAGPIEVEGSIIETTPTAYATLGAAFTAINSGTHTGAISIDVCGDTSEGTGTAVLNASGSGAVSYTSITMSPAGGAGRTISGATTAGSPMIDFNGADNVTINGLNSGGNSLTISNTTNSATSGTSTIRFIGGATGNTITNSNIQGSVSSSVATNGAVIFFSTDAVTTNGNDNNTISNNNIGPAGANLPTKAILGNGSTTTTAIGNSGIIIDNNNIFDYFGAAVTSSGVATNGGCNAWTITNNRFYQTGTRTWTTGATHRAIDINNTTATSGAQGFTITGNIVGYASNTQTGVYTLTGSTGKFQGIVFNGITSGIVSDVNNNTVASVSLAGVTSSGTGTTSPFIGIMVQTGVANTNNNTVGSQSATDSLTFSTNTATATHFKGIYSFASNAWTTNNNNIGGISVTNSGSATMTIFGMHGDLLSSTLWTANSNNVGGTVANSISLNATGVASQVIGFGATTAPSSFTGNTIRNMTTNIGTGTTTGASIVGINATTSTPNHTLSQNTIFNLSNTNPTAASVVTGIQFTGSTANVVERNFIYGLTLATNSTAAEVNGIRVSGGTTIYRNNMIAIGAGIANAIGTGSTTGGVNGINEPLGTDSFFHNSVYIGGSPTAGVGPSFAFNSSQTINTRSFRNNIFFNGRNNAGATGKNYIVRVGGTTVNPSGLTINNNVYFANGAGAVFGLFNGLDAANLAAWQIAVGQDAASFEANPQYNDPTNAIPDLHLHPTNSTVAEGNGADVGVTNDFDGQTRSGLTPVDIGADAGNFAGIDLVAPNITYTPFLNTSSTANRIQTVTITDVTGVATGGNAPRIYFNKNAGSYFSTACVLTSGTINNGTWDCTIDNSLIGGVVATDTIRYFVVAQDTLGNLASNPSAGFSGTNVNTVTTPPTAPNQYLIVGQISGTFNVGAGETYTSLTNTGGIFEFINNSEVAGNITINITSDLSAASGTLVAETGAVALNQFASPYTITIKPSGGPRLINGPAASTALIRLNGASRVTIDGSLSGGTDRSLTIENTSATSPQVVRFGSIGAAAITANTLKNCIVINGANTSSAVVVTDNAGTAGTFNNITIQNNDIQKAFVGVFTNAAILAGNGSGLLITQNKLDTSGANALRNVGVYVQGADGATVSNNTVGNFNATDGESDTGIWFASGTVNSTISGNTVTTLGYTGTSTFPTYGIRDSSSAVASGNNITQNTISSITSNGTPTSGPAAIGIDNLSGGTIIQRNNVQSVIATNTGTYGATGINVSGGNNVVLRNNFVSNVTGDMTGGAAFSTTFGIFGIRVAAGTGHQVYNNSVNLYGARPGTATTSLLTSAFALVGTTSTGLDVRNNIFANNITGGTTSVANVSVYLPSGGTSAMNLTMNNNSYYYGTDAARQGTGQAGTTAGTNFFTTLTALTAYTSTLSAGGTNDNASIASTGAVPFVNDNDLHITNAAPEFNTGATIASVTIDYDGETRPQGASFDIGADEVTVVPPGTIQFSSATYSVTESTATVILTVTRTGGSGGAITANYSLGGGTATGTAACGTPGEDYVNTGGSVSFADGDAANKTFTVAICNDAVFELNQTFDATLSIGSGSATLGTPNPATVTITNDDDAPGIAIGDVAQAEGNAGTTNFGFGITVTGASEVGSGFLIATADGTATAPSDYTAIITTAVSVPADVNRTVTTYPGLTVSVNGDTMFEANETFFLNSSGCTDCTITDNLAVGTIQNDDVQPTVQFSSATYTNGDDIALNRGKTDELAPQVATITVTRSGATGDAFTVNYATVTGGTATGGAVCVPGSGVDYVSTSGNLSFAAGETSKTFDVTVCTDNLFEGSETVNLALTSPTAPVILGTPNASVLTITDNDLQPSLQFSSATYSNSDDIAKYGITTDELAPSVATITVTRTGAVDNAVAVNYATSNGTATGGASCTTGIDYVSASGTLNFAAGETSKTFNVTVCTDGLFEGNENVNLTLSNPTGGAALGSPNTAILTIIDNDAQPSLQFTAPTYSVGEAGPSATITVTRTGAPDNTVSVNYATVGGGTALGGGACGVPVDYVNTSGTLNFANGEVSKTFTVPICEDALTEPNETINLQLSGALGASLGTPSTAVLTIIDNETDTVAPVITYTPISSNPGTTSLTATVTDAVGVTGVSIFWRINGGSFTSAPCSSAGGTPQNGTWTCIITGATNPSAVSYYVTATDGTNTTTNPTSGAAAPNLFTIGVATIPAGTYTNLNPGNFVLLGGDIVVNNSLTLNGIVDTGANKLTLDCGAIITGGGEGSYVIGRLERFFCANETFTFHVGASFALPPLAPEANNIIPEGLPANYSPVTVQVTGGTSGSSLTVSATDAFLPGSDTPNSISRYWTLTENGDILANLAFTYRNEDVNGNENNYKVLRREGGFTRQSLSSSNNPATNTATISSVQNFSDWGVGLAIPTAANALISGRLTTPNGEGIRNVTVMLTGGSLTAPVYQRTGAFGNYSFDNLTVGQTYTVTLISKRYTFTNPVRIINLLDNATDVDFEAEQQ